MFYCLSLIAWTDCIPYGILFFFLPMNEWTEKKLNVYVFITVSTLVRDVITTSRSASFQLNIEMKPQHYFFFFDFNNRFGGGLFGGWNVTIFVWNWNRIRNASIILNRNLFKEPKAKGMNFSKYKYTKTIRLLNAGNTQVIWNFEESAIWFRTPDTLLFFWHIAVSIFKFPIANDEDHSRSKYFLIWTNIQ